MKEQRAIETQGIKYPLKQKKEPFSKRLFTVTEASVYLGRSIPAIRELIWAGHLPVVRLGRRIHIDLFDLDRFIEQHKMRYNY